MASFQSVKLQGSKTSLLICWISGINRIHGHVTATRLIEAAAATESSDVIRCKYAGAIPQQMQERLFPMRPDPRFKRLNQPARQAFSSLALIDADGADFDVPIRMLSLAYHRE
ncbi:hypothetical protein [Achromobacter sp. UBA2119]|uniref:hypothetical protein n=1 Tax=Achromobacter sp. UBA2119 TaxID=1945911 RepID=UPI00257DB3DB|nr:hypothetical protein [Achromobacter sp. UBA2119]